MSDHTIILPSKPKIVSEKDFSGVYEIDSLYPGYGHTLGNSLRRIILSSLPGAAITSIKIDGVNHEFSTIPGVKEDVIVLLLNLKKVSFKLLTDEPQEVSLHVKGPKTVTAEDIKTPGQVEVLNKDQFIAEITDKKTTLDIVMTIERGLGYIPKEVLQKDKVDIGTMVLDAVFTPIRRVNYEVENMRVGDRTDYNKLRVFIETNGTIMPREALEQSVAIMIKQLKAIVGFQEEINSGALGEGEGIVGEDGENGDMKLGKKTEENKEFLKTRVDTLDFSTRTANALNKANIRTVGGLARKAEKDLHDLDGLGEKGIQEVKKVLGNFGITLK